jgi:hypothetical protein
MPWMLKVATVAIWSRSSTVSFKQIFNFTCRRRLVQQEAERIKNFDPKSEKSVKKI